MSTDTLAGRTLKVTASVKQQGIEHAWSWTVMPQNGSDTLWFPLAALPDTVNADMLIVVTATGLPIGNITILRRLLRAPKSGAPEGSTTQIWYPRIVHHQDLAKFVSEESITKIGLQKGPPFKLGAPERPTTKS